MALGDISIIGDVTQTLSNLLNDLSVTLDSPADLKGDTGPFQKINLYLYQVLENPYTKNQPWVAPDAGTLQMPPLTLNLYYLLTPYASDQYSAHTVLGHAMRVFYDNGIITGSKLAGSLRTSVDKINLVLSPMKLEELTRIWNALQTPYRLSVCYEVRVIVIESEIIETTRRVEIRSTGFSQIQGRP